uniref:Uncharacterized protein n=1 Tax=Alexandrium monilatum TaxID=311494 RepID=A0A7S4QGW6_9DINO|mmetsp:Transcript_46456/g.143941  ORF Transcript_46456/g.143941 Transcript_46456/m.143941 type:complete len:348 (-) Transcript_46456:63-1106(-)
MVTYMPLIFLWVAALSCRAGAEEVPPAQVDAALAVDDHCTAGARKDDVACALSAVQLLGAAAKETTKSHHRRRRHHVAQYGRRDISHAVVKDFREALTEDVQKAKNMTKVLDALEKRVNECYRMLAPKGPRVFKPYSNRRRGHKSLLEKNVAMYSTRRRRGLAPRAGTVQTWMDNLQKILDTEWRRQTRCSRLHQWMRMKLKDPDTAPFQEQMQIKSVGGDLDIKNGEEAENEDIKVKSVGEGSPQTESKHSADDLEEELADSLSGDVEEEEEDGEKGAEDDVDTTSSGGGMVTAAGENLMEAHMTGQLDEMEKELGELGIMIGITEKGAAATCDLVTKALSKNTTA